MALTILPATLAAVPSSLVFSVQAGASTTVTQTLAVGGMGWTVPFKVVASGGAWLSSSSVSGNSVCVSNGVLCTPATVSVTVNPNGLSPGTYIGMISITPTGGNITSVPVTFTVVPAPTVTASPTSLSFTYQVPGSAPLPATLQVSGSVSGSAFSVTTATQTGGNWLSVTPTTGLTPSTVSVLASPAGLPPGNYSGSVTVTGANGATGTTIINVSLIVVAVPTVTAVVNAASFQAGAVAPGELISIGGAAIGPTAPVGLGLDSNGSVLSSIGGVRVTFLPSNSAAPLIYASSGQINAVVPYEIARSLNPSLVVKFVGQTSNVYPLTLTTTVPALFTLNGSGTGPAAAVNENGSINSLTNPAVKGSTVVFYLTGEGQTTPPGVTGKVTTVSSAPPLTPQPLLPVAVLINGQPAPVTWFGEAPGVVSGVMQLNVQIPVGTPSGTVPIEVSIGGSNSPSGVTISVQ